MQLDGIVWELDVRCVYRYVGVNNATKYYFSVFVAGDLQHLIDVFC